MTQHLLLTGATGLLGRYLIRDLLLREEPLAVLVRPQKRESAEERLAAIMAQWDSEGGRPLPRPVCLEGDITRPGLGLSAEARQWVAGHCRGVLHSAASLTFDGSDRAGDPWLSNLTGTQHVLDLCESAGLSELHYVSTAYVCGRRPGPVLETELTPGVEFRNDYEASKYEAEQRVRAAPFVRDLTVYRPAIIVGDARTGYTSTYHGFYPYLQFVWMLSRYAPVEPDGRWHIPVRLNLTGDERRNLVPVDWVSAVIAQIVHGRRHHGQTYHLAPPRPVTARELEAAMADMFKFHGPTFVGPDGLDAATLNDTEKGFYEYVGRYAPYWSREPIFDCRNTQAAAPQLPCPDMDLPLLRRLIEFAVADRWGKGQGPKAKGQSSKSAKDAEKINFPFSRDPLGERGAALP